jgi:AcrR family transcriptional regulator
MQERAQRTRRAILQAAATAFETRGYGATRLQDITAQQDVSKGALYFHFPSKESLAIAIIQENDALWPELIEKLRPQYPRAIELLIEFSWRVGEAFLDNVLTRAGMRLMLETKLTDPSLPPPFSTWIGNVREVLAEAQEQGDLLPGVITANVARFMVATFTGLQQVVLSSGGPTDPEQCIAEMWRCLLPGLVPSDRLAELKELLPDPGRS